MALDVPYDPSDEQFEWEARVVDNGGVHSRRFWLGPLDDERVARHRACTIWDRAQAGIGPRGPIPAPGLSVHEVGYRPSPVGRKGRMLAVMRAAAMLCAGWHVTRRAWKPNHDHEHAIRDLRHIAELRIALTELERSLTLHDVD